MKLENQAYQDFVEANPEMQMMENNEESPELDPEFFIHGAASEEQSTQAKQQKRNKNKRFSCRICGKMFKFKRNEMNHRFQEHNKDNQCYICNVPYQSLSDRKEHKSRFHKNGKMCEICETEFVSSNDVENHQIEQHQGRQFKCNLCSSEMMYDAINQHFQNVHYQGRTKHIR